MNASNNCIRGSLFTRFKVLAKIETFSHSMEFSLCMVAFISDESETLLEKAIKHQKEEPQSRTQSSNGDSGQTAFAKGANLPLPMPLKVDKIAGGARLGFIHKLPIVYC
ncbi:hypothetical protein PIB30_073467 [Stylosanthes scabra]|uniref:DUF7148 domain-containing protein n=1 Tax=Stylosanthes scabra TaxID=79078 RepID=A0ABU6UN40_9FABA|nr:hypothetical protein [Stylosanthes scabra]